MTIAAEPTRTVETLFIQKESRIAAPPEIVFETLLEPIGPASHLKLKIEPFPGGRWFRDLGNNTGHLWGHVQVIKPPTLLELSGPMFMSYPAISHVQYRLAPDGPNTILTLTHQAIGLIPADHMTGVQTGWQQILDALKAAAEERKSG